MMDGVLENFTGAMLEPYGDGHGGTTDNRGLLQIDPDGPDELGPGQLDALGFQPHFHAIGDRAVRASLDAVEAARRANGPSDTRPHIAHIQVIHPDDIAALPDARRRRQRAAAVGGPRGPDGRADDPVHRRALALAVPVPVAAGGRRRAGDGLGLERLEREPASGRCTLAVERRPPACYGRRPRRSSSRTSGSTSSTRSPASRPGSAYVNHLDARDRHARGRQGRRPRRARPRPVRPRCRRDRRCARRRARSSRASPCSRTPRSTAERTPSAPSGGMDT